MSSTCNIAGCSNDSRQQLRHRQIVMPHVMKLQFHRPNPDDFPSWQSRMDANRDGRDEYRVSAATRVCSNHFRNGCYKKGDTPALYMRGYPSWSSTTEGLLRQAAVLDDGIVRQIAVHVFHHLSPKDPIFEQISDKIVKPNQEDTDFDSMLLTILEANPTFVCDCLCQFFNYFPVGKVQEAIAKYKFGQEIDCKKCMFLKMSSSCAKSKVNESLTDCTDQHVDKVLSECDENMNSVYMCRSYNFDEWHNYCHKSYNVEQCHHNYCEISEKVGDLKDVPAIQVHQADCKSTKKLKHYHSNNDCSEKKVKGLCKKKKCNSERKVLKTKLNVMSAQVIKLTKEVKRLKKENTRFKNDAQVVKSKLNKIMTEVPKRGKISVACVKQSDELVKLHTGLPSVAHFNWLFNHIEPAAQNMQYWKGDDIEEKNYIRENRKKPGPNREMSLENEMLVALMMLKLNMTEEYLAFLFGVSVSLISTIISTWLPFLSLELEPLIHWPEASDLPQCYPTCFEKWENVTAIIDCFEIPTEKPSHVEANSQIFSSYKNRTTVKFLLACTPGGSISYISPPAGGNMSDVELVRQTQLPTKFKPGDACMADKGFRMEGDFLQEGVRLIIPPFVKKGKQFTHNKNVKNKHIAHARIHVERVIGRVRDYQILNSVIPITRLDLIGPAARVCCALTNLKESVVRINH